MSRTTATCSRAACAERGYEVATAADGPAALAAVASDGFDLVLLDIMMPGMSGLEVLEALRKEHTPGELPIVMATARSDSEDIVQALDLGANDYITKPIDFPVVLARVQSHLKVRTEIEQKSTAPTVFKVDGSAEPGTVLDGRYELRQVIGEGGFAVVYEATQLSTGQEVAVKLLRPHRVAALSIAGVELARFEREMKLIGKLEHPHVVRLVDSGSLRVKTEGAGGWSESGSGDSPDIPATRQSDEIEVQGPDGSRVTKVPYLVMELLKGEPLSLLLRREAPLSVPRAIEVMAPVLSAVGLAHQAGVIHRDLKPPNIFITRSHDGRALPEGARLRHRQAHRRRLPDPAAHDGRGLRRHARVHGARAGAGRAGRSTSGRTNTPSPRCSTSA